MSHVGDNDGDMLNIELTERQQKIGCLIKISPTITVCQMSKTQSVSEFGLIRAIHTPDELNLTIYGLMKRKNNQVPYIIICCILIRLKLTAFQSYTLNIPHKFVANIA